MSYIFSIESKIVRSYNKILNRQPSSYPFISGDTFMNFANIKISKNNIYYNFKNKDIVFVKTDDLHFFETEILPNIKSTFNLITHNSDKNIIDSNLTIAENKYLNKWFAQNNLTNHPKIINIPIGLENASLHRNGIIKDFQKVRNNKIEKKNKILSSFSTETNFKIRKPILEIIKDFENVEIVYTNSKKYRTKLNEYKFVISPPGNGIDCHRTWEALYFNVIPIVVKSDFYDKFDSQPFLMIDNWQSLKFLNEKDLISLYESKKNVLKNSNFIWAQYWKNIIFTFD
jgi:hypothetical protein